MEHSLQRKHQGRMIVGATLIILGTALLLQQFDVIYVGSIWHYWPFLLCFIGIGKIVNPLNARELGEGAWFIFLGLWLYISINHIFGLSFRETWPAILIAWGCSMIWKSFFKKSYHWVKG